MKGTRREDEGDDELEDDGSEAVGLRDLWGEVIVGPSAERVAANRAWAARQVARQAREEGR